MSGQVTINFSRPIAIFPLPNCVLLPHGLLPLHVFEPRYRQMTRDVLDTTGLIAMALFEQQPDTEQYRFGQPKLRDNVCLGHVEQYEAIEDGRYVLLLRGLCRAQIVSEVPHEPYRKALLEPTEWPPAPDAELPRERREIEAILDDPLLTTVEGVAQIRRLFAEPVPTVGLIDLLIGSMTDDVDQRYDMLTETDAHVRADWLVRKLAGIRETMRNGRSRA
jgi:Lon protease-like protein